MSPIKKPKVKALEMPVEPLIKPGMKWKPLIASGPKAPPSTGIPGVAGGLLDHCGHFPSPGPLACGLVQRSLG